MDYNRYRRYFIILDNEENGFDNKQGKNPKGYTKIEIKNGKGVLSHYIQNLKYFKNAEYIYRGYLIGTKEGQEVFMDNGTFVIDESGKGEITWRFDPANVDGKGTSIDGFNVIAVVAEAAEEHHRGEVAAPLVGFINKDRAAWKHILSSRWSRKEKSDEEKELDEKYEKKYEQIKEILKDVQKELPEEIIEIVESGEAAEHKDEELEIEINIELEEEEEVPAPEVKEEVVEEIEEVKEEVKEEVVEEVKEEIKEEVVENIKEEIKEEVKEEVEEEVVEEIKEEVLEKVPEETALPKPEAAKEEAAPKKSEKIHHQEAAYDPTKHCQQNATYSYYNHYFKMVCDYVDNILKYHKKVEPFEKNMDGCQWWKVDYDQQTLYRTFLPFYGYVNNMYGYYPHMNYMTGYPDLMYKYQHYIFGKKCDEKGEPVFYLYGIPGRYLATEQPYEGMTGFVYWHPIEDREPRKGDYGYWILHIDARSGNIVMPLKPTPPPAY